MDFAHRINPSKRRKLNKPIRLTAYCDLPPTDSQDRIGNRNLGREERRRSWSPEMAYVCERKSQNSESAKSTVGKGESGEEERLAVRACCAHPGRGFRIPASFGLCSRQRVLGAAGTGINVKASENRLTYSTFSSRTSSSYLDSGFPTHITVHRISLDGSWSGMTPPRLVPALIGRLPQPETIR